MRYIKLIKNIIFLLNIIILSGNQIIAQNKYISDLQGDQIDDRLSYKLHFEYINSFIVLRPIINNRYPMYFIFDTGAENTIFIKPLFVNLLNLKLYREYKIMGADFETELIAYLTKGINFSFRDFDVKNLDALIFKENYLDLDPFIGKQIVGIIGANFFKNKIIKIDYTTQTIEIIPPKYFKIKEHSNYTRLKMEVKNSRGFINASAKIGNKKTNLKLMVDTGAATTALLHTNKAKITIPEVSIPTNIANGLGGEIQGYVGRIESFSLGGLKKNQLVVNFQDLPDSTNSIILNNRDGILGNGILDDFTLIYDNINGYLYIKPNKDFYKEDKYDRSGIFLLSSGPLLKDLEVHHIIKGSPADQAGILVGDKVLRINGWGRGFLTLNLATRIFQKKLGKKIKIKIERKGVKMKKTFILRKII